jgi:hypothetical protein
LYKLLAVYDSDILYASRLMEYFNKCDWEDFEALLFTKKESLLEFLKNQPIEILLWGGEDFSNKIKIENIKYIFRLSSEKNGINEKAGEIYKYQSAEKIASEILSCYTRLEDNNSNELQGRAKFIGVFSPVPGEEKLSYAWALAKGLSGKGKVLYISFEQLPVSFMINNESSNRSMSELIYYLRERKEDYISKIKAYLNYSEKLSYLSGPSHGFDLLTICKEDIVRFMDDIREHTDYELVVFYLGIYTEATMEILSRCSVKCIAACASPYEELVSKEWEEQMRLSGIMVEQLNINRIILPTTGQIAGDKPLPENIYTAIKPMTEELIAEILSERSRHELFKG